MDAYRSMFIPPRPDECLSHARWCLGEIDFDTHLECVADAARWDERYVGSTELPGKMLKRVDAGVAHTLKRLIDRSAHVVVDSVKIPRRMTIWR